MPINYRLNYTTDCDQEVPDVLALPNGALAVVWEDATLDPGYDGYTGIRLSVIRPDGSRPVSERRVGDQPAGYQFGGHLAPNEAGFVVGFEGEGPDKQGLDDPYFDTYFQRFDASGQAISRNVQVTAAVTADNRIHDVGTLADSSFVVLVARSDVDTGWAFEAHRFAANGSRLAPRFCCTITPTPGSRRPSGSARPERR